MILQCVVRTGDRRELTKLEDEEESVDYDYADGFNWLHDFDYQI